MNLFINFRARIAALDDWFVECVDTTLAGWPELLKDKGQRFLDGSWLGCLRKGLMPLGTLCSTGSYFSVVVFGY